MHRGVVGLKTVGCSTMRGPRRHAIVSVMRLREPLRFEIEIQATGPPVTGRWRRPGQACCPFVGWTELFAALDAAVSCPADPRERNGAPPDELTPSAEVHRNENDVNRP